MTPDELATCWVPVPLRWRHVREGDVFVGADGALWHLESAFVGIDGAMHVEVRRGAKRLRGSRDPDEVVRVLWSVPERDAGALLIDELGARVAEMRAAG